MMDASHFCFLRIFAFTLLFVSPSLWAQNSNQQNLHKNLPVMAENAVGFSRHLLRNYKNYLGIIKKDSDQRLQGQNLILELNQASLACDYKRLVIKPFRKIETDRITEGLSFLNCGQLMGTLSLERVGASLNPTSFEDLLSGNFPLPKNETLWHLKNSWNQTEVLSIQNDQLRKTYFRGQTFETIVSELNLTNEYLVTYLVKLDLNTEIGFQISAKVTQEAQSPFASISYLQSHNPIDATSFNKMYPTVQWQIDSLAVALFTIPGLGGYTLQVY